jgi:hypothetical protein
MPAFKGKKGENKSKDWVPTYNWIAKKALAPYPQEKGSPFWGKKEKAVFKAGAMAKTRKSDNCLLQASIGKGVTMAASTFDVGSNSIIDHILKIATAENETEWQEATEQFGKTGLPGMAKLLASEGNDFLEAVKALNVGKTKKIKSEKSDEAVQALFKFLEMHEETLRKEVPKVASFAARAYTFAMALFELLELYSQKKTWSKNLNTLGNKTKATKEWKDDAKDPDAFLKAVCAEVAAKIKKNKGEDSSGSSKDSSAEKVSSDDSSEKKNDKSDSSDGSKKGKKRKAASDDGEEEGDEKKKKQKSKKEAKDKKGKKAKKSKKKSDSSDSS